MNTKHCEFVLHLTLSWVPISPIAYVDFILGLSHALLQKICVVNMSTFLSPYLRPSTRLHPHIPHLEESGHLRHVPDPCMPAPISSCCTYSLAVITPRRFLRNWVCISSILHGSGSILSSPTNHCVRGMPWLNHGFQVNETMEYNLFSACQS